MFRSKVFQNSLGIFIILNLAIYLFISLFYKSIPFENDNYYNKSHHYFNTSIGGTEPFNLVRDLGMWDAQWYLRIADAGYPSKQVYDQHPNPTYLGGLSYAFFPFYPMILSVFNVFFRNIEITAFLLSIVIMIAVFFSMYYVISKLYTSKIALRAIFLLFLFPFSIFYRVYYTEGIFLLMLIWWGYFLIKSKWGLSTIILAFMFITRPSALPLMLVFLISLFNGVQNKKIKLFDAIFYILFSLIPFLGWIYYCYLQTGDAYYWYEVQAVWYKSPSIFVTFVHNISTIFSFGTLSFHDFKSSKIDTSMIVITFILLVASRKFLKPQLWWISLFIWLVPLLTRDTMSYTRYEIISFPLFIYLGAKLKGLPFYLSCGIFLVLLLITSLYLVNWYWVA